MSASVAVAGKSGRLPTSFVHQRVTLNHPAASAVAPTADCVKVNITNATASAIPLQLVPDTARRQLVLLVVDVRERFVQNKYRRFYLDNESKCEARLPAHNDGDGNAIGWRTEEEKLELGDLAIAYEMDTATGDAAQVSSAGVLIIPFAATEKEGKRVTTNGSNPGAPQPDAGADQQQWMSDVIVERKALSDLISRSAGDFRSRCGTAKHMVQEMRHRQSGLQHAFMLLEGSTNVANIRAVPLTWSDQELTQPDVIATQEAIASYMCAVLARNYSRNATVRVLRTLSNSNTCLLASALLAVEMFLGPSSNHTSTIDVNATRP